MIQYFSSMPIDIEMLVLGQTAMIFNIFISKENKDFADSLYQLLHSQPLSPKKLESSFPTNYSRFPVPIGINDRLFRNSTTSCSSQ